MQICMCNVTKHRVFSIATLAFKIQHANFVCFAATFFSKKNKQTKKPPQNCLPNIFCFNKTGTSTNSLNRNETFHVPAGLRWILRAVIIHRASFEKNGWQLPSVTAAIGRTPSNGTVLDAVVPYKVPLKVVVTIGWSQRQKWRKWLENHPMQLRCWLLGWKNKECGTFFHLYHLERIDGDRHSHVRGFTMAPYKSPPFGSGGRHLLSQKGVDVTRFNRYFVSKWNGNESHLGFHLGSEMGL